MHIIMFVERVEKFADFILLRLGEFGKLLRNVANFARHDRPAVGGKPLGNCVDGCAFANEFRTRRAFGNVIILFVREGLDFIRAGLDCSGLAVNVRVRMMRLDEANVVEQKFITARCGELAFFKKHADFRRGAVHIIRINLNNDGHVVRRAAFIDDVIHDKFFVADARAFIDGALDGVFRHAFFFRFFNGGEKPRIRGNVRAAHFGGNGNFANQFSGRAAFF